MRARDKIVRYSGKDAGHNWIRYEKQGINITVRSQERRIDVWELGIEPNTTSVGSIVDTEKC